MTGKKTVVLEASENPSVQQHSNRLSGLKHPVVAVGRRKDELRPCTNCNRSAYRRLIRLRYILIQQTKTLL